MTTAPIVVSSGNKARNTHHVKLSRSGTEVGLILCDNFGRPTNQGLQRVSQRASAIKTYTGQGSYSDDEPPYMSIAQENFSGGRGLRTFDEDQSRYYDGYRVDTQILNRVALGPHVRYASGDYRVFSQSVDGTSITWQPVTGSKQYIAQSFVAPAGGYTATEIEVLYRQVGTPPANLWLAIYSDVGSAPGVMADENYLIPIGDTIGATGYATISLALTAGTTYWVVAYTPTDDVDDYWEVVINPDVNGKQSTDGTTWIAMTGSLSFRVLDAAKPMGGKFFEYKRGLYFVSQPDSGANSRLYINGDRGAADSNAADKTKLNDATKTWTVNQWAGCIALIVAGPGSEEDKPWRAITSNTATALTCDATWNIAHTTATEYVILGANTWDELLDIGAVCTDVAVAGELVYFARGDEGANAILRYEALNSSGTWTQRSIADVDQATHLMALRHPLYGMMLYGVRFTHPFYKVSVWEARVPTKYGPLYHMIGTVLSSGEPWDAWEVTNVTPSTNGVYSKITIAAGFGTGVAAVKDLPAPVNVTGGTNMAFEIYSDISTAAGDLQLLYDDQVGLGKAYIPDGLDMYDGTTHVVWTNAKDGDTTTATTASWTTPKKLYITAPLKFNRLRLTLGVANANPSVLSARYFDGNAWTAITIDSDGSTTGGATFGQDGVIEISPVGMWNWEPVTINGVTGYTIELSVSADLDLTTTVTELHVERKNNKTFNLPALVGGQYNWVELSTSATKNPLPDETQIKSVGINVAVDNGAQVLFIGDIVLLSGIMRYEPAPNYKRINNIIGYSGGQETPRENPWVFAIDKIYELQTENDNLLVPIALGELGTVEAEDNGQAVCVNGPYLYFNIGPKIERYYNRNLDDVGPDRDDGLPDDRQGNPAALLSYPGRVYAAIDGGDDNYSSILVNRNGWHEVYRAPAPGLRIRALHIQPLPGLVDRLWFTEGSDICYTVVSLNPELEENYLFTHEAILTTGRYYGGRRDISKYWATLKLATEELGTDTAIHVDYRTDNDSAWIALDEFTVSPFDENQISNNHDVTGKWIQFRVRLETTDRTKTPVLTALIIEALQIVPVRFVYQLTFRSADKDRNLAGSTDPWTAQGLIDQIDTWVQEPLPLTLNAYSSLADGKIVRPEPVPVSVIGHVTDEQGREIRICRINLLEV